MEYKLDKIEYVKAIIISGHKLTHLIQLKTLLIHWVLNINIHFHSYFHIFFRIFGKIFFYFL